MWSACPSPPSAFFSTSKGVIGTDTRSTACTSAGTYQPTSYNMPLSPIRCCGELLRLVRNSSPLLCNDSRIPCSESAGPNEKRSYRLRRSSSLSEPPASVSVANNCRCGFSSVLALLRTNSGCLSAPAMASTSCCLCCPPVAISYSRAMLRSSLRPFWDNISTRLAEGVGPRIFTV